MLKSKKKKIFLFRLFVFNLKCHLLHIKQIGDVVSADKSLTCTGLIRHGADGGWGQWLTASFPRQKPRSALLLPTLPQSECHLPLLAKKEPSCRRRFYIRRCDSGPPHGLWERSWGARGSHGDRRVMLQRRGGGGLVGSAPRPGARRLQQLLERPLPETPGC